MNILLTGATGFLGSALLCKIKQDSELNVSCPVRKLELLGVAPFVDVGEINESTDFSSVLAGIDVVVHVAARVHVMRDESDDPLSEYRKVNVFGTANLARQAVVAGVRRFVFISSVKVSGEFTRDGERFVETMVPNPEDPYARSKFEAEEALKEISVDSGMEFVIIRPPLVYGRGVKANFTSLMKLCTIPVPLPFSLVHNKRSMIYLENLVDFIVCCIYHPKAANEIFLISDDQDLSLSELIRTIRREMGRKSLLFPVPVKIFECLGGLIRKQAVIGRLTGNLQINSSKARTLLGWSPPYSVTKALEVTVSDFLKEDI